MLWKNNKLFELAIIKETDVRNTYALLLFILSASEKGSSERIQIHE